VESKICTCCHITKPVSDFTKHKKGKSGLYSQCKQCTYTKNKEYKLKNKEKVQKINRKWRQENREWNNQRHWLYRKKNPDKVKLWEKNRYEKHRERRIFLAKINRLIREFDSVELYYKILYKYDGWCAFACGRKAELIHHKDGHSISNSDPKIVKNEFENLIPLCRSCHVTLHNKVRNSIQYLKRQ